MHLKELLLREYSFLPTESSAEILSARCLSTWCCRKAARCAWGAEGSNG